LTPGDALDALTSLRGDQPQSGVGAGSGGLR
jgi:hypothetical protein